jgi:cytochrome c biogenesis protein ResB
VFQVARDSGVPLVLLAAILVLVGLLPALYTSRRKVWVRAERAADHTVLAVGGFALQRRSQFEEEFARLVRELVAACGGDTSPTSDRSREQVSSP